MVERNTYSVPTLHKFQEASKRKQWIKRHPGTSVPEKWLEMPHLVADLSGEMNQIFTDQQPRADVTCVLIATSMVWRNMVMSQCCLSPGKLMTGPGNVQMRGDVQRQ